MRIYIAGPMRGRPFYNFPAFDKARDYYRRLNWTVISPADLDREVGFDAMACPADTDWNAIPDGFDFRACVARDLAALQTCKAIHMLQGWEDSKGAKAELAVAEWMGLAKFWE